MPRIKYTARTTHRRQMIYLCAIVCVYLMLPILICIGVTPWNMEFATLVVGVVAMYIVMRILGNTHSDIGITQQYTIYSLKTVLPITIALLTFRLCTYHLRRYAHRCCYEHRRPFLVSGVSAVTERHRRNNKPRGTWRDDDCPGNY